MKRKLPKTRYFIVSFKLDCTGKNPCTEDIKDALGEFFGKDVLRGTISDFKVSIDYPRESERPDVWKDPA